MSESTPPVDSAQPANPPAPSTIIPSSNLQLKDFGMGKVEPNKARYSQLMAGTAIAYGALTLGAAATWFKFIAQFGGWNLDWGPVWLLPIPVHLFGASLLNVEANEKGAVYWYGECVRELKPGLHFIPARPFTNVVTFVHDTQPIREPAQRDKIFWGDEKEPLPKEMVRPIFMNTRSPNKDETKPLDVQIQVGVSWEVIWVVDDVPTFLKNMHSLDEAEEQIRGISAPALGEVLAQGTADDAIADQASVNVRFLARLQELTENWGVAIRRANLTSINTSHDMAKAMRDRAEATFIAETKRIEAGGEADAIKALGEARGHAARAETSGPLIGRAEGYAAMARTLEVTGSEVLAAETARETIPGANATILGEAGLLQVASIGKLFGAGLKAGDKSPEKGEKE